jgi:hypothetical protein
MKDEWLSIKINSELKERIRKEAEENHRSLAGQAAYLIERGLERLKEKNGAA